MRFALAAVIAVTGAVAVAHKTKTPTSGSAMTSAPHPRVVPQVREPVVPRRVPGRASRHHSRPHLTRVPNGPILSVTAYCPTGNRTASGEWPHAGGAASNLYPLGTRLAVDDLGTYIVNDRVGWGTDVDLFFDGPNCEARALAFGRRHLRVVVER